MEIAIICLLSANLIATLIFGFRFLKVQNENAKFRLEYFESKSDKGLIKKTNTVTLRGQVFYGQLPIGNPMVLGERVVDRIDERELQIIKQEIIGPFVKVGMRVLEMKTGLTGMFKSKISGQ